MAYIGRSVDVGMFEKQVLTADSSTTTFTLTFAVGSANSLLVVYGGVIQEPAVAYSVSGGGQQIVFSEAPATGTTTYIIYLGKQLTTPRAAGQETTKQTFAGDGSTVTFTLTDPPVVPAGIMVFVDGILQREGSGNNYVSSGSTITFTSAPDSSAEIDVYTLVKEKVSIDTVADGSITVTKLAASHPTWNSAGDFTFPLTGSRIRGDFSSSPQALRVAFQTSTTNGNTNVYAIPNGSSTNANWSAANSSDASNASVIQLAATSTDVRIQSTLTGTGAYLPLTFLVGGSERARIDTSGRLLVGSSSSGSTTSKLQITGGAVNVTNLATSYSDAAVAIVPKSTSGYSLAIASGASDFPQLQVSANGAASGGLLIQPYGGDVSIGGTTNSYGSQTTLTLSGSNVSRIDFRSNSVFTGTILSYQSITEGLRLHTEAGYPITFYPAGTERMRIDSSGNLGIGTAAPSYKLHVRGADATATLVVGNTTEGTQLEVFTYQDDRIVLRANDSSNVARTIAFETGTSERMRIGSTGGIGIGQTVTTNARIQLDGNADPATFPYGLIYASSGGVGGGASAPQYGLYFDIKSYNNASSMNGIYCKVGQNVGGTTYAIWGESYGAAGNTWGGYFKSRQSDTNGAGIASALTAETTTNIGAANNGYGIAVTALTDNYVNNIGILINSTYTGGSGQTAVRITRNNTTVGSITTTTTATAYVTSSDYRLKENVAPMTGALDKVAQLNPVTYDWKADGSHGQGFIAHELQTVVPECVHGEKDAVDTNDKPIYQGIDTSFLVATLTAAIQELKAIVDAQAVEIAALKAK